MKKTLASEIRLITAGTWSIPDTPEKLAKAKQAIKTLEALRKEIYSYLGDDILFDHLDNAQDRIKLLIKDTKKQQKK